MGCNVFHTVCGVAGIGTLFVVRHPDTTRAPHQHAHAEFPAIDRVGELLPA